MSAGAAGRGDARPRPGCPVYGLAAPALRPLTVAAYHVVHDKWTEITLGYGEVNQGPYVTVTTTVTTAERDGTEVAAALREAAGRSGRAARSGGRTPGTSFPGRRICRPGRRWCCAVLVAGRRS